MEFAQAWLRADARISLIPALLLSVLAHAALILGTGTQARKPGTAPGPASAVSVRILAALPAMLPFATPPPAQPSGTRRKERALSPPAPQAVPMPESFADGVQQGAKPGAPIALLGFDPNAYLRPREVEDAAVPVSGEALDLLRLSGNQPGLWVMRLFIGADGSVDEVEVVESRGSEANTAELADILRSVRFTPAQASGVPVKSQKMLEFSFEPGSEPLLPVPVPVPAPVPIPSATGK